MPKETKSNHAESEGKECKHEWTGINTETNRVVCSVCFIPMPIEAEKGLDWGVVLKLGDICLGTIIDESVGEPIWKMPRDKMIELFRTAIKKAEQAAYERERKRRKEEKCLTARINHEQATQAERTRIVDVFKGMLQVRANGDPEAKEELLTAFIAAISNNTTRE